MGPKKITQNPLASTAIIAVSKGRQKKEKFPLFIPDPEPTDDYNHPHFFRRNFPSYVFTPHKQNEKLKTDPLFSKNKEIRKQAVETVEHFFYSWLIRQDYISCKRHLDREKILFVNTIDRSDGDGWNSAVLYLYYCFIDYEALNTKIINHVVKNHKIYYRVLKRNGKKYDFYIDFRMDDKFLITRIETGPITDKKNRFIGIPEKEYPFGVAEKMDLTPLPIYDPEYQIQQEKGTLYAMLFKVYKNWFILQDVNEMKKMMTPKMMLDDKELNREYENGRDCAHYFFTFIAHHNTTGIQVKQYKIVDNELIVRIHWPEKKKTTDIMAMIRFSKQNLITDVIFKKAYSDIFNKPGDITIDDMKKIEENYLFGVENIAGQCNLDENRKGELPSTFSTSDTEFWLNEKIINKETKQIGKRINVPLSPKVPYKLIFAMEDRSDEDLFKKTYADIPEAVESVVSSDSSEHSTESGSDNNKTKKKKTKKRASSEINNNSSEIKPKKVTKPVTKATKKK
jgi:hypothetical protein